jgi:hypothetical protein
MVRISSLIPAIQHIFRSLHGTRVVEQTPVPEPKSSTSKATSTTAATRKKSTAQITPLPVKSNETTQ